MTQVNLENITLSERSQMQKTTYSMIQFMGKSMEIERILVRARVRGERNVE